MKDFRREHPEFSLCGLRCALCPMHLGGYCPGCGGGEGHQSCAVIRCAREKGISAFCTDCAGYPCPHYLDSPYDSFVPYGLRCADLERMRSLGWNTWKAELDERSRALDFLLEFCNDGRRKRFFALAAYLLPLQALESTFAAVDAAALPDVRARAALAADLLRKEASTRDIALRLNTKPRK